MAALPDFRHRRGRVGGDVRAGFVDDADDAERDAHLADLDAGRAVLDVGHLADRVGQRGDLLDAFGHAVDALLGQRQAVEQGGFEAGGAGGGQVFLVGGDQRGLLTADGGGDVQQRSVLFGSGRPGQAARGGAGLAADGLHVFLDIHCCHRARQKSHYSQTN